MQIQQPLPTTRKEEGEQALLPRGGSSNSHWDNSSSRCEWEWLPVPFAIMMSVSVSMSITGDSTQMLQTHPHTFPLLPFSSQPPQPSWVLCSHCCSPCWSWRSLHKPQTSRAPTSSALQRSRTAIWRISRTSPFLWWVLCVHSVFCPHIHTLTLSVLTHSSSCNAAGRLGQTRQHRSASSGTADGAAGVRLLQALLRDLHRR